MGRKMNTLIAWFLISNVGTPAPTYSMPFTTEAECLKVKEFINIKRFDSATKCMKLTVFVH